MHQLNRSYARILLTLAFLSVVSCGQEAADKAREVATAADSPPLAARDAALIDCPLRDAFGDYIEKGGGYLGIHGSGGDPIYFWDW